MKRLVLLIFAVNAFAFSVNAAEGVLIPSALKERFAAYWSQRAKKHFDNTYRYELPYLQYLHDIEWYEDFFEKSPRIKKIDILKAECKKQKHICRLYLKLYFKRGSSYYTDKWINVNGKWYHKYVDRYLPF